MCVLSLKKFISEGHDKFNKLLFFRFDKFHVF